MEENDLAHGEWSNWLKSVNFNDSQARKFIKVSNEFQNRSTSNTLGVEALYQIATLPEPERTKEHITSNGETKTPDEMTVRELRELKKQLKQRDEQNAQLQTLRICTYTKKTFYYLEFLQYKSFTIACILIILL